MPVSRVSSSLQTVPLPVPDAPEITMRSPFFTLPPRIPRILHHAFHRHGVRRNNGDHAPCENDVTESDIDRLHASLQILNLLTQLLDLVLHRDDNLLCGGIAYL